MQEIIRHCVAVFSMLAVLAVLSWTFGFSPEGLLNDHWPVIDDHPTNWYDTALHPDAQ